MITKKSFRISSIGTSGMYIVEPEPKNKKKCRPRCRPHCIFLLILLIVLVAGLSYGIHAAIRHFDTSADHQSSKQTSLTPSLDQQIKSSTIVDVDSSTAISPSSTVIGQASSSVKDTAIVVSSWTRWQSWGSCSTSCGGGVQTRTRICDNPRGIPSDQIICDGKASRSRNCSEWKCPDCGKICATGKLNSACDACICINNTLSGKVKNQDGVTLDNVTIALAEFPFSILARTNIAGFFEVQRICVSNEDILLQRNGYSPKKVKPTQISSTNTLIQTILTEIVFPYVIVHPEDKLRFEGDNVTFCCKANAKPDPLYEWLINGRSGDKYQYDGPDRSMLILPQIIKNMSGQVKCRAYNDHGAEFSNFATLKVLDRVPDSCNSTPFQKLTSLPNGCVHLDTNSTIVDLGKCSNKKCIGGHLPQTNTCLDKNYCCQSKTTEEIQIRCASVVNITLTRITSCGCDQCFTPISSVRGVAKGAKDNSPFVFGSIFSSTDGKRLTRTGRYGSFFFEVPLGTTRLVVSFKDDYNYNDFYELTKVIPFQIGHETFVNVRLRSRPEPVTVNATEGFEILLGGNTTQSAIAAISIPPQGLMTADGEIYNGTAKVMVDFLDPRNESEMREAAGDFTAISEDGEEELLETFGMMKMDFKDNKGEKLQPNEDIDVSFDPGMFNMTIEEAKAVQLWFMDEKTGRWRVMSSGLSENQPRRSKRSERLFFFGKIDRDKYTRETNIDYIVLPCAIKIYVNTGNGAVLTVAVSTGQKGKQYYDYQLKDGEQCIRTYCKAEQITIQAVLNGEYLIPRNSNVSNELINKHDIQFHQNLTLSGRFMNRITIKLDSNNIKPPFYSTMQHCDDDKQSNSGFLFEKQEETQSQTAFVSILRLLVKRPSLDIRYWYEDQRVCFIKIDTTCQKYLSYFHVESLILENNAWVPTGYTMVSSKDKSSICAEFKCPRSDTDKVNVSISSLTPYVIIKQSNQVLRNSKFVWKTTPSKSRAYHINVYPKYDLNIPTGGIMRSDRGTLADSEKLNVKKTFMQENCDRDDVKAVVTFRC